MNQNEEKAETSAADFLEALYGDPLRAETIRTGRHLIVASAISITVVLFKVRLQSTTLIPLDFGDRIDVLPMLLSIGVALLLASFFVRAFTDMLRDREAARLVARYGEGERANAAEKAARDADEAIDGGQAEAVGDYDPDPDEWWKVAISIRSEADKAVEKAAKRVGVRRLPQGLRAVRKWLEICVPIIFASIALMLARSHLSAFAVALISAFQS
jgi:hypothetical protein